MTWQRMTRINAFRTIAETRNSFAWGKQSSALIFAAVLIVCSVTVGCSNSNSKDQPKPVSSNNQIPATQPISQIAQQPTPLVQAENKPVAKKVVHKRPATANYSDKTSGVTFEYPRRYAIETGNAATELLASNPIAMNFVQPGGVALAAVELPETSFANTDFSSAFFNVSIHKTLTADQCTEFAVPQPKVSTSAPSSESTPAATETATQATAQPTAASDTASSSGSKLMLGDLELRGTEAVAGEGTRQSDSKYFHVFQNGACYEFTLNVTTVASEDGVIKHVDRDKVFDRLEKILATVKINPIVTAPEATAEAPSNAPAQTPAQ
jgi:hypothetical protein